MTLPVTTASRVAACILSHSRLTPPAASPSNSTSMLKPVVKVSGNTTRSVCPANGPSNSAKRARLAAGSCQRSGCCSSDTRNAPALISSSLPQPCREGIEAHGGLIQRTVHLGNAQTHERQRLGLLVEGRQRDGGDPRFRQQA